MFKKIYTTLFGILFCLSALQAQYIYDLPLMHDGEAREYSIFLPQGYQAGMELPLVLNLHGLGSNGIQQTLYTQLANVADTANFIIVTPEGLVGTLGTGESSTHWNSYFGTGVDDLGFLNLLIDKMYTDYNVDLSRVYSTGMSNGGFMSYRLACELSDRITAIASITGSVLNQQLDNCTPSRAVPIMEVHGTSDEIVPFEGVPLFGPSIPDLIDFWVDYNNCDSPADTIQLADINTDDMSTVDLLKYENGDGGAKVWFYIVENGGHTWPGAAIDLPDNVTNRDFSASVHVWDFFKQFVHPNPAEGTLVNNENVLLENIKVIANATTQELIISSNNDDIEKIQLWDMLGRNVFNYKSSTLQNSFREEMSNLQTGIYVVTVETTQGIFTQKVFF